MRAKGIPWFVVVVASAVALPAAAHAKGRTLHVQIDEKGGDRTSIEVPLSFVRPFAAMASIPGHVHIEDEDGDGAALREAWSRLRGAQPGTAIVLHRRDAWVRLVRETGRLAILVEDEDDSKDSVRIDLPDAVADAVLGPPRGTVDFDAMMDALADASPGTAILVESDDETVRISVE